MARKDITMNPDEVQAFLAEGAPHLIVTTLGADQRPHVTPLWYVMENGKVAFRSFRKSQRIVNLRRNPTITTLVEDGLAYTDIRGVMIQGTAKLLDDPDYCLDLYVRLARRYAFFQNTDEPMSDVQVRDAFAGFAAKNTAVIVEPDNVITWDHAKLGGGY